MFSGPLAKHVPGAKGNKQSPIDIVTSQAVYDESLGDGQFKFNYHPDDFVELLNTGCSWQINLKQDPNSSIYKLYTIFNDMIWKKTISNKNVDKVIFL